MLLAHYLKPCFIKFGVFACSVRFEPGRMFAPSLPWLSMLSGLVSVSDSSLHPIHYQLIQYRARLKSLRAWAAKMSQEKSVVAPQDKGGENIGRGNIFICRPSSRPSAPIEKDIIIPKVFPFWLSGCLAVAKVFDFLFDLKLGPRNCSAASISPYKNP